MKRLSKILSLLCVLAMALGMCIWRIQSREAAGQLSA